MNVINYNDYNFENYENEKLEKEEFYFINKQYLFIKRDPKIQNKLGEKYVEWINLISVFLINHQVYLISSSEKRLEEKRYYKRYKAMLKLVSFEEENEIKTNINFSNLRKPRGE